MRTTYGAQSEGPSFEEKWQAALQERQARIEAHERAQALKIYSSPEAARAAIFQEISDNERLHTQLLLHFKQGAPLRVRGETGVSPAFAGIISSILESQGKGDSPIDLLHLKLDLEDPVKFKEIFANFFQK